MINDSHVWVENEDLPAGLLACSCGTVAIFTEDQTCPTEAVELRVARAIQAAAETRDRGVSDPPVSESLTEIADRLTGDWESHRQNEYDGFYGRGAWAKLSETERGWRLQ